MDSITILGAGMAGLTLAQKVREKSPDIKITLIDKNSYHFCKKNLVSDLTNVNKRRDILSLAEALKVKFISGCVERINPNRKKVYFKGKDNEPVSFENLVIAAGLSSRKIEVKGGHREGFFYFSDIEPLNLRSLLKISSEAAVYVFSRLGLKLALSLRLLGKEVSVVAENLDFLAEDKQEILNLLKEKGISLYLNSSMEEAVGESMIKAVKISPLKVFSSQLVFIDSGFMPNIDFFEEEVRAHDNFFTGFEGVYLLGDCARQGVEAQTLFVSNCEEAKQGAEAFAEFVVEGKMKPGTIEHNEYEGSPVNPPMADH